MCRRIDLFHRILLHDRSEVSGIDILGSIVALFEKTGYDRDCNNGKDRKDSENDQKLRQSKRFFPARRHCAASSPYSTHSATQTVV